MEQQSSPSPERQLGLHRLSEALVLGSETPAGRVFWPGNDLRFTDDLPRQELLASQIDLQAAEQTIPEVDALTRPVAMTHIRDEQIASDEILQNQRCDCALSPSRV